MLAREAEGEERRVHREENMARKASEKTQNERAKQADKEFVVRWLVPH